MNRLFLLFSFLFFFLSGYGQYDIIRSGPMLGYSTMKEVGIWIQLKTEARVILKYSPKDSEDKLRESYTLLAEKENEYITRFILPVEPGTDYNYEVYVNDKKLQFDFPLEFQSQTLWQHRTDPPNFKMAIGSCAYINEPKVDRPRGSYGENYGIFQSIADKDPDLMLWLGDNAYLREVDWNSKTGIYHRFSHSRDVKEMRKLLASTHNYAIWDDHDFGPNNSDASFWNKKITERAFKDFWMNPNYNMTGKGGITGTFFWNDCQFFLLDNRYFRTANNRKTGDKVILGDSQVEWLINALKFSKSKFKFVLVGGQFISNAEVFENHINLAPEERQKLIDLITAENIKGVIFLSGDRHHTELSKLDRKDTYPLYDWTVSPLTAGAHETEDEGNSYLVPGSKYGKRNFGLIEVNGTYEERKLLLKLFNSTGEQVWKYEIKAQDLN